MKYIIALFLVCFHCYAFGQVRLVQAEVSKCYENIEKYKFYPSYQLSQINDSIIRIQTRVVANCIGIYHPRIQQFGPVLNLDFDNFRMDSINTLTGKKEPTMIHADCICFYAIKWDVAGMAQDTSMVFLIRGRLFKNYDTRRLDQMLSAYQIINERLVNGIDKHQNRQGQHEFREGDKQTIHIYRDGILEK